MEISDKSRARIYGASTTYRKSLREHKVCLYPGCTTNSPIIRAHSVSKSKNLRPIAEKSHVLWTHFDVKDIALHRGRPPLFLEGINIATTFRGFCQEHDAIFQEIDQDPHNSSPRLLFLHAYRTLAAECWWASAKRDAYVAQSSEFEMRMIPASNPVEGFVSNQLESFDFQIWTYFKLKELFDAALLAKDWSTLRAYEISFDQRCPIASTIGHTPNCTFSMQQIHIPIFFHKEAPLIFISLLPLEKSSKFFAIWHEKTEPYIRPFVESLDRIPNNRKSDALLRLFFMQYGNLAVNQTWWDSLEALPKEYLSDILYYNLVSESSSAEYIVERGIEICDWKVTDSSYLRA